MVLTITGFAFWVRIRWLAVFQRQYWELQVFLSGCIPDHFTCCLSTRVLQVSFLDAYQAACYIQTMVLTIIGFPFWMHIRPLGIVQQWYLPPHVFLWMDIRLLSIFLRRNWPLQVFLSGYIRLSDCLLYSNGGTGHYGFSYLHPYRTTSNISTMVFLITGFRFLMHIRPLLYSNYIVCH